MTSHGILAGVHAEGVIYGWVDISPGREPITQVYIFADDIALGSAWVYPPDAPTAPQAGFALIPHEAPLATLAPGCQLRAFLDPERTRELAHSPLPLDADTLRILRERARTMRYQQVLSYLEDIREDGVIYGWAFDPQAPAAILPIYIYAEDLPLGVVHARIFRPDLHRMALGDGRHGFGLSLRTRAILLDKLRPGMAIHAYFDPERRHEVAHSPVRLPESVLDHLRATLPPHPLRHHAQSPWVDPATALRYERMVSHLDGLDSDGGISGWAMDPEDMTRVPEIYFYAESHFLGSCKANRFREDLLDIGVGNGRHGFLYDPWEWPQALPMAAGVPIHAFLDSEGQYAVSDSPFTLKQEDIQRLKLIFAIHKELQNHDPSRIHTLLTTGPALPSVAFITMIKDEGDIILTNLSWHYRLGFRKFIVIDNASTDHTRTEILLFRQRFPEAVLIIIDDPITAHLQAEFTTGALRLACAIWPDLKWVFPVDADEFLCLEQPLETLLAAVPDDIDTLIFPKSFYKPVREEPPADDHTPLFQAIRYRTPLTMQSSKMAVRAHPHYRIDQGNHTVSHNGLYPEAMGAYHLGGHYREFSIRSLRQFRQKVINGGQAILAAELLNKPDIGGSHWRRWYADYLSQGEAFFPKLFASYTQPRDRLIYDPLPILDDPS